MALILCRREGLLAFACLMLCCPPLEAGDWPQILGPHRTGVADDEQLAESWPSSGPKLVWKQPVGSGLAGPVVSDGRVILFHRLGDEDVVQEFDATSGMPGWKKGFPARFRPSINPDDGPRAVPLIYKKRVYVFGATGELRALSMADGYQFWLRKTHEEFGAREGYFGAGSSPLVAGDRLLLNVGGRNGAAVVAFALDDGETVWKAFRDNASYSSPVLAEVNGVQHAIFITRYNVVSLDPQDGSVRFQFAFGKRGPTVSGANPLVVGDRLFVTAHYRAGAVMSQIGDDSTHRLWANDDSISSHYPACIYDNGHLYGIHGQDRRTPLHLRCVEADSGKVVWSEDDFGIGTPIFADDKILLTMLNGEVVLVRPSPEKYIELARAKIGRSTTRALPALANGKLYFRDQQNLYCVDVGK